MYRPCSFALDISKLRYFPMDLWIYFRVSRLFCSQGTSIVEEL